MTTTSWYLNEVSTRFYPDFAGLRSSPTHPSIFRCAKAALWIISKHWHKSGETTDSSTRALKFSHVRAASSNISFKRSHSRRHEVCERRADELKRSTWHIFQTAPAGSRRTAEPLVSYLVTNATWPDTTDSRSQTDQIRRRPRWAGVTRLLASGRCIYNVF